MTNALLGCAIGDALGKFAESKLPNYQPLLDWDGRTFLPSEYHGLAANAYTDDTQMSIMIAESLIENKGFDPDDLAKRYVDWIVSGRARGYGRMLSLETELPTPTGFIKLKNLQEGDRLFDEEGNICKVLQLHPIDLSPKSYRLTFDDGTIVDACANHLWRTYNKSARMNVKRGYSDNKGIQVRTTQEILDTLRVSSKNETNHSIPNTKPINYAAQDLPIDPYLLGLWLGDGSSGTGRIETADPKILHGFEIKQIKVKGKALISKSRPYTIYGLKVRLRNLNLLNNKHIPDQYLYCSYDQRLALLQGLMDSDGHCNKINNQFEFVSVFEKLSYQTYQLITSLGIKAKIIKRESWRYNKRHKDKYRIYGLTKLPIFRLKRKLINIKKSNNQDTRNTHRYIVDIKVIPPVPMRCITVDSPSHLFLITKSFIATHNTTLAAIQNLIAGKHWSESGIVGSYGNATAMRATPFGVWFRNDLKSLIEIVKIDSKITHASAEAEAGALAIALAAAHATNHDTEHLLEKICLYLPDSKVKTTLFSLNAVVDATTILPSAALAFLGTRADVRQTVPSALYCFLKFDNYQEGCETIIRAGGDCDTNSAILSALYGAQYGMKHFSEYHVKNVEDSEKLITLDSQLYNRSGNIFFPRKS